MVSPAQYEVVLIVEVVIALDVIIVCVPPAVAKLSFIPVENVKSDAASAFTLIVLPLLAELAAISAVIKI